ncbi:MAG TPA: toll/interleukin-1 receptor domain-containing protein, partial [Candidatus Saccharimonadales bacterium]|nr:toll/interleukin-1 receptor domain-containing protein [Candidatus Saccharimonadales bacterium]
MHQIFISHSHEDSDFAEILHERLAQAGFAVWRDTGIRGGEDWRREIDQAIQAAFALIVMMTSEAKA